MTKESVITMIEHVLEGLKQPLYNSLEVGFRHTALRDDEKLARYKETCSFAVHDLEWALKEIKKL